MTKKISPSSSDSQIPSTLTDGGPLPKLVAFDLDYTLWFHPSDTHVTAPLKATKQYNNVNDRYENSWSFYDDVPHILHNLRDRGIKIAAASRTHAPEVAREMLSLLVLDPAHIGGGPPKRSIEYFDFMEIYPGSKVTHFKALKAKSGVEYDDMLFFDDEARNRNVDKELGVVMILVPKGVSKGVFDKGVLEWRKRQRKRGS